MVRLLTAVAGGPRRAAGARGHPLGRPRRRSRCWSTSPTCSAPSRCSASPRCGRRSASPRSDWCRGCRPPVPRPCSSSTRWPPTTSGRMTAACLDRPTSRDEVVEFVSTWSDGLPFMVEEVLAGAVGAGALAWDGERWSFDTDAGPSLPVSFVDNVHGRLRGLGPEPARVLRVAAVLGRRFDWTLLPAAAEVTELEVMAALRAGVDAQLLVAEPGAQFRFRHALTRDAVLDDLLPRRTHARLPRRARRRRGRPPWTARPVVRGGGQPGRELRAARARGRAAARARTPVACGGALGSAEQILDRARTATSDAALEADIDEVAAEVLALAGKTDQAIVVGSRVATSSGSSTAPRRGVPTRTSASPGRPSRRASGTPPRSTSPGPGCVAAAADDGLSARVDTVAAHAALGQGEPEAALLLAERALATAESLGDHELACEALEVIGRCWRLSDAAASEQAFDRGRVIAETHGLALWRTRAMSELAWLDTLTGGGDERLRSAHDQALACGAWGSPRTSSSPTASGTSCGSAWTRARAAAALRRARRAPRHARTACDRARLGALGARRAGSCRCGRAVGAGGPGRRSATSPG